MYLEIGSQAMKDKDTIFKKKKSQKLIKPKCKRPERTQRCI